MTKNSQTGNEQIGSDKAQKWSVWMPLSAAHPLALQQLPEAPGLFRIRDERTHHMIYEGTSHLGLRVEIERLSRQIQLPQPPTNANPLALELWHARHSSGASFQICGARL